MTKNPEIVLVAHPRWTSAMDGTLTPHDLSELTARTPDWAELSPRGSLTQILRTGVPLPTLRD